MEFYKTKAGKLFFERQLPHLIDALTDIAAAMQKPRPVFKLEQEVPPDFLESLYNGYVDPAAYADTDALKAQNADITVHQKQMREAFTPEMWEAVEQYRTLLDTRGAMEQGQAFAAGFRYAAVLLAAGLAAPHGAVQPN